MPEKIDEDLNPIESLPTPQPNSIVDEDSP